MARAPVCGITQPRPTRTFSYLFASHHIKWKTTVWDRGWAMLHIFQHLQLWSINIWQRPDDHLPCAATYILTCVSEIPITLYWIVKRLLRLCFLQMLHARWISLDSRGNPPRTATVIYGSVETGRSSCYWYRQQFQVENRQQVGEVCLTPSAPKCTLKCFYVQNLKKDTDSYAFFFVGVPPWKCFQMNPWPQSERIFYQIGAHWEHNFARHYPHGHTHNVPSWCNYHILMCGNLIDSAW